jgi:beta-lactamase superfamily II metal-dependent hydrolase
LKLHFLNVGHGDCTIIEHASGNITMIDINNGDDIDSTSAVEIAEETASPFDNIMLPLAEATATKRASILATAGYDVRLTNPVQFLADNFRGRPLFRYIQSHPDLDHMRGLTALRGVGISIWNFWDTHHEKETEFFTDADESDWGVYEDLQAGNWNGSKPTVLRLSRNAKGQFYNQSSDGVDGGDGIHILAPTPELTKAATESGNSNNLSYVLWIQYQGIKVVLGGDAEEAVWQDLFEHYGSNLKCHVLKASHHGRDSGYHQDAVKAMSPDYTIVSVGKKPSTDASNKYRQFSENVWSTRWWGTITLTIGADGRASIDSEYDR